MKFSIQQMTLSVLVFGLAAVTIVEALRPGTVGGATNLGVVTLVTGILLIATIKTPSSKPDPKDIEV